MADMIRCKILNDFKQSGQFSIIIDTTTVANLEQFT